MLTFDIKRKINTLRDILVGKVPDPKAQVEQITIALIYKFMDDIDIEGLEFGGARHFFSGEYEKYAWTEIMKPENSGRKRAELYADGIKRMTVNPHLPSLFRDIFRGAYIPYQDPDTMNMFLKEISDFSYDDSEDLGNAFEYLLSIMGSQGDAGQFRTPRHIIDMMVEIVNPQKYESILDPACGTAGFLVSAYRHILEQNRDEEGRSTLTADDRGRLEANFAGYDISPDMVRLSRVNMYLHHFTKPKISEYDTLTSEEKWDDHYDVIFANPPFMTPKGGIVPHSRYRVKARRSEVLFVDYIAEHLNPAGRAAVIVPEGIVFQAANAYRELRRYLVDGGFLYAVISLPGGVFNPYSSVKTSILLMDRAFAASKKELLFLKLSNDGFDLGAQRREIEGSEVAAIVQVLQKYRADPAAETANPEIREHPLVTLVDKRRVSEYDYILVGDRYQNQEIRQLQYPVKQLGDLCDLNLENIQPLLAFGEGSFTYIDISSVENETGEIDYSHFIPAASAPSRARRGVRKGDILFSTVRPNMKAYGFIEREDCGSCVASTGFAVITAKEGVSSRYVFYMLFSEPVQAQIRSMMGKGAYPSVNQKDVARIRLPLPPLPVQEEIAAELDGYRKIVQGARQVIRSYRPILAVDSEWETIRLGEVCELNPKKTEVREFDGEISFVPMADLSESEMYFEPRQRRFAREVYGGYTYFRDGDVLLAKVTPCFENGKSGLARGLVNGIGFGSSELFVLRADTRRVLPEYVYYVVSSYAFREQGATQMTGTGGLQRLTKDFVLDYPISLPPLDVQRRVVARLETETALVQQNKRLVSIFEKKIRDKVAHVWGRKDE